MKKITFLIVITALLISCLSLGGCGQSSSEAAPILRFHVRAQSNSEVDQAVKLKVRDKVLSYLDGELADVDSFEKAKKEIEKRKPEIKKIADEVLKENGFDYTATVRVGNEYFPTRMYGETVVESGYYDAVIIELGSGEGDNWWCVLYPPLCYVEAQAEGAFKYKSKLKELIEKYFGKKE